MRQIFRFCVMGFVLCAVTAIVAAPNEARPEDLKPGETTARKPVLSKEVYKEIRGVLEKKFADPKQTTAEKLDQAAAGGLLETFGETVRILSPDDLKKEGQDLRPVVGAKALIPPFIGYVRLNRFDPKTPETLWPLIDELQSKDHISGLVLDLRYVKSDDYATAARIASLFLPADLEIFKWERADKPETVKTVAIKDRITLPVAVLVNEQTEGAAEVVAAVLKENGKAVVVGRSSTAGHGFRTADQKLSDGRILRYATERVKLAKGDDLFGKGLVPDIQPEFAAEAESAVFSKPFEAPVEIAERPLLNEAILTGKSISPLPSDLEKERKERVVPPANNDLVLQRAIDLLKGMRAIGLN